MPAPAKKSARPTGSSGSSKQRGSTRGGRSISRPSTAPQPTNGQSTLRSGPRIDRRVGDHVLTSLAITRNGSLWTCTVVMSQSARRWLAVGLASVVTATGLSTSTLVQALVHR